MRITNVEAIPIRVPRRVPMVSAEGTIAVSEFGIVRVDTSDGVTGWGEISMSTGRVGRSLSHDVNLLLAPLLIGRDPTEVNACAQVMEHAFRGSSAAKAGVEMALLDITGKAYRLPLYRLLGGSVRDGVPVAWPIAWGDVNSTVQQAGQALEQGFRAVKLKIGRPGRIDLNVVAAVRSAVGPDVAIKVDGNMAYRGALSALKALKPLEEHDLQLIEQPLPADDLDEIALLRRQLRTPLLTDESSWDLRDIGEIVRRGAADAVNIYIAEAGGVLRAAKAFAAAEAAGLVGLLGSQCELGIGTAAAAHLGVTLTNLAYESDVVGVLRYPRDIVKDPPRIEAGKLFPPDGPGLGVTVDEAAIAEFRVPLGGGV